MTKIVCPNANCLSHEIECYDWCEICKGKGWIPHPTCNQCDSFYLDDKGHPSKVSMCRVFGISVVPFGYCHVHSELLEEK